MLKKDRCQNVEKQKKLPKWVRNICRTKKCAFNNLKNIAHYHYNGFEEKKYIYIYIYLRVNAIVRLLHPENGETHWQEMFLAFSADKQTRKYDTECSNLYPSLSTLRSNGLSCKNIKK